MDSPRLGSFRDSARGSSSSLLLPNATPWSSFSPRSMVPPSLARSQPFFFWHRGRGTSSNGDWQRTGMLDDSGIPIGAQVAAIYPVLLHAAAQVRPSMMVKWQHSVKQRKRPFLHPTRCILLRLYVLTPALRWGLAMQAEETACVIHRALRLTVSLF